MIMILESGEFKDTQSDLLAGVGGVILDFPKKRGNPEIKYAWSLGQATNNQAEEYALLKGVQLAKGLQLQQLIIMGDSKNTIQSLIKGVSPNVQYRILSKKSNLKLQVFLRFHFFMLKGRIIAWLTHKPI
jgi:ribonuclease HI